METTVMTIKMVPKKHYKKVYCAGFFDILSFLLKGN